MIFEKKNTAKNLILTPRLLIYYQGCYQGGHGKKKFNQLDLFQIFMKKKS